jgi:two-component system, NarL family, sensor histidine kinase DegS
MTLPEEKKSNTTPIEDPQHLLQAEVEEINRSLKEITLMLEQSRVEVGKLTQRNAAVTAHLQQIQNQVDKLSGEEVRQAYDSALDAQQRLFVMRSQLEKLQNDQSHLERHKKLLDRMQSSLKSSTGAVEGEKSKLTSVEMLVNAQEAERQRLSRQMHDGPAQALSNFILQTEIVMRLLDVDENQARSELGNLKIAAMNTFQKVRNFIFELRPMMLDDLGLVPTIRRYADAYKEQSSVEISMLVSGTERRLEPYIEVMVFRAMQELLGNAVHQNQATSVKIQLDLGDTMVKLSVDDNGKGFDADTIERESNIGLKLIKDRVEMLGGTFTLDSTPGLGTRLSLAIPVQGKH